MKDIKKMLTHPMRNPYDKTAMKSNLVVMQDYKPPFGQPLFPNGALIAGPERTPNNVYIPAKLTQGFGQNSFTSNDISFAASTPDPRYLPAAFNTIQQTSPEYYQRQRQNGQYQSAKYQNAPQAPVSNGHAGQFTQINNHANLISSRPTQSYNNGNAQYGQRQLSNTRPTQSIATQNAINSQRGQLNQLNAQYTANPSRLNSGKQADFGISLNNQQYNSNQVKQPYTYQQPPLQFSNAITGHNEVKQNLVSTPKNEIPSTVITKTITLKQVIQEPKRGGPKSRITVKTWIVKPSKSGKLINATPYTYDKPTQAPSQKLVATTPYVYNKPTTQSEKLIQADTGSPYVYNKPTTSARLIQSSDQPYVYNKPTQSAKIVNDAGPYVYNKPTQSAKIVNEAGPYVYNKPTQPAKLEAGPYVYNKPTVAAKQIASPAKEPSRSYLTPTTPRPTPSRLYLTPSTAPPTQSSRLYLAPTTYNPSSRLYLPPSNSPPILSRQYLLPTNLQQNGGYESEQLRAAPTTPSPVYALPETEDFNNTPLTRPLPTNQNNISFADILTKEKLDLTVDDIVKDTKSFLNTASPEQFGQYRSDINIVDYPDENYLPPEPAATDSGEHLTSQAPTVTKSARLISTPSTDLEPPVETFSSQEQNYNSNPIANLPFYKESLLPANTIERTVSLKISIPEKIATYLFKNNNDSDFDKLEILNTGSSNYLVLTNNVASKSTSPNFIPIGKLIADKQSNISNSQALVFSLLADSINVAKGYSNTAQQQTTNSGTQFENINTEDLSQITNQISQLTSSQYSGNNQDHRATKLLSSEQANTDQGYQYRTPTSNNLSQNLIQAPQRAQYNVAPTQSTNQQFARYQTQSNSNIPSTNQANSNQVYSGQLYQLPVPDVTSQVYNRQNNNAIQSSNIQQDKPVSQNNNRSPSDDVEIIKSQSIPFSSAKLQAAPTSEVDSFNSQDNFNKFINSHNGISAQLQDKIVGTINHPLEDNKVVTYKKDESYYVYTKLDNTFGQNIQTKDNNIQSNGEQKSAKIVQGNNLPNLVAFQFVPSISYQLEDEKEQQKILNAFQIDEFGSPKQNAVLTSNVDYTVDHTPAKQVDRQFNELSTLYAGPSSYSAPQSSVGNLLRQNLNARLELEDNSNNNGYSKQIPARRFSF